MPLVSINLCCYNSERYLQQTLDSICAQTYTDWELVIVNDGSTDGTEEIVRRYEQRGVPIVYCYQANKGLGAARNAAIAQSSGEYIALIDHDDLWLPDKLVLQMKLFADRPSVGVVYCDADFVDSDGAFIKRYSDLHPYFRGRVLDKLFLYDFIVCSSAVIRKSLLDTVGGFPPNLRMAEEYAVFLALAELCEFDYVEDSLVQWRIHGANASLDSTRVNNECRRILRQIVARNEELRHGTGRPLLRVRLRNLPCTYGESLLLRGQWRSAYRLYGRPAAMLWPMFRVTATFSLATLPQSLCFRILDTAAHMYERWLRKAG